MNETLVETSYWRCEIKDGIIYGNFVSNLIIDVDLAKKIVQDRLNLVNGNSYPVLISINNIKSISKDARDYFSSEEAVLYLKAGALIVGSQLSKMMGNFFLTFNKPQIPVKMFTDEGEAITWLKQYAGK